jgi:hypothetical protein
MEAWMSARGSQSNASERKKRKSRVGQSRAVFVPAVKMPATHVVRVSR